GAATHSATAELEEIVGRDGRGSRIELEDPRPLHFTGDRDGRPEDGHENLVALGDAEILGSASPEDEVVEVDPHGAVAPEDTNVSQRSCRRDRAGEMIHDESIGGAVLHY